MNARSWLFVPADSERKLAKAESVPADILILDLEDSVMPASKPRARELAAEFLQGRADDRSRVWVRMNPQGSPEGNADLSAIMKTPPGGIVLPKAGAGEEVEHLGRRLGTYEAEHEHQVGSTRILPIATETPAALFPLGSYRECSPRLAGLTWGAEDLAAAIGASANRDESGCWTAPYQLARSLCLFAAHTAGVQAVDTIFADFRDPAGLDRSCAKARRDGFTGKLAIHPAQVETINRAFTPSAEEVAHAERIVALFEANPGAGVLELDGAMVDIPHLVQARKILERATPERS